MPVGSSTLRVTDQFCGAGGSSIGAKRVDGISLRMAMNHWDKAVETHNHNHPEADHDCADISLCDPKRYPYTEILITSPECTTYSNGAAIKHTDPNQLNLFHKDEMDPSIERSRATMLDVIRWAEYHRHEAIIVENVVEVRRKYHQWNHWLAELDRLGYRVQFCLFNSRHFHKTPQSRDRVYIVCTKKGNPAPNLDYRPKAFCHRCQKNVESVRLWKDIRKMWGKYGYRHGQYFFICPECKGYVEPYYYAAYNIVDWDLPIKKVGDRKYPLSPKTLERIAYGIRKFARPFLDEAKAHAFPKGLESPVGTVVAGGNHHYLGIPAACLIEQRGREYPVRGLEETFGTVVGSTIHQYLAVNPFLFSLSYGGRPSDLREPVPTQTTKTDKWLCVPPFISEQYGRTDAVRSLDEPTGAVVARSNPFLAVPPFLLDQYGREDATRALTSPAGTVTTTAHPHLVVPPFILDLKGPMATRPISDPMSTQATAQQHMICTYNGSGHGVHHPLEAFPTAVTRDRAALVEFDESLYPPVEECGYRMFEPHEIQRAMAFPDDYVILGSKDDKVCQLGNAVTPPVMEWIVGRVVESLSGSR